MRRGLALGLLGALALPAMGSAQGVAVWCAPTIVTTLIAQAPRCGREVSAAAVLRAARMVDAAAAATERLQGAKAAYEMREQLFATANRAFDPDTECTPLQRYLVILDRLESERGEAMVAEQAAHAARATTLDGTCL